MILMKCVVVGSRNLYEPELEERLKQRIEELMQEDDEFEFWFVGAEWFEDRCLNILRVIREERSDKRIKLIRLRMRWEEECFPMKKEQAQEYDSLVLEDRPEPLGNAAMNQKHGMIRRMIRSSDAMLCCQYTGAFFDGESYLMCAQRAGVSIYNAVNQKMMDGRIQERMNLLTDRERYVMDASYLGRTTKSIGDGLGVSANRIHQIRMKIYRKVVKGLTSRRSILKDKV